MDVYILMYTYLFIIVVSFFDAIIPVFGQWKHFKLALVLF